MDYCFFRKKDKMLDLQFSNKITCYQLQESCAGMKYVFCFRNFLLFQTAPEKKKSTFRTVIGMSVSVCV